MLTAMDYSSRASFFFHHFCQHTGFNIKQRLTKEHDLVTKSPKSLKEKKRKKERGLVPHLLLSICVLVHSAQGVLYSGQPSREAQQQADHPLQVSYEQVVPLQLHGQTALTDQSLQGLAMSHVLLNLCLQGATRLFQ